MRWREQWRQCGGLLGVGGLLTHENCHGGGDDVNKICSLNAWRIQIRGAGSRRRHRYIGDPCFFHDWVLGLASFVIEILF